MEKQQVLFKDLGIIDYKAAWDYQEELVKANVDIKAELRKSNQAEINTQHSTSNTQHSTINAQHSTINAQHLTIDHQLSTTDHQPSTTDHQPSTTDNQHLTIDRQHSTNDHQHSTTDTQHLTTDTHHSPFTIHHSPLTTTHHLLFCEHLPVYTLGKSGNMKNVLLSEEEMNEREIEFFQTNRGGDITFHGLQQVVGYPILDLEKFYTDIGKYLRDLEEVIILTLNEYDIKGERSKGETGVWLEPGVACRERKICAMGIRCSRWITMHGFALNVNTDLAYFENIIPCGIKNKMVTSMKKELGNTIDFEEVKEKLKRNFENVFNVQII